MSSAKVRYRRRKRLRQAQARARGGAMRTQRLAAWPPLAPEQVPSFPTPLRDGWRLKELKELPLGQDRRYWPIDDPVKKELTLAGEAIREGFLKLAEQLRPIQRKAVEEARSASGFFAGVRSRRDDWVDSLCERS